MSYPENILVVVLKDCGLSLSYISADIFNMYLEESYFTDCQRVLFVVPMFKHVDERYVARTTAL